MSFPRFHTAPIGARGIAANVGITLRPGGDSLRVEPRPHPPDPTPPSLCSLPLLPAPLIHRCCWFLNDIWHRSHCCAGWALYIDTTTCSWHAFLPPQTAGLTGALLDLGYRRVAVPAPRLRLAGSLICLPAGLSMNKGPWPMPAPIDGVHLALAPEWWLGLLCTIHADGAVCPGLAASVIDDAPVDASGKLPPDLAALYGHITLVSE